uniref:Uncharacterized protein n=1 Tax=Anguilla anguilla TaxID=7936 RepID=A0A0E9XH09_ANGAN
MLKQERAFHQLLPQRWKNRLKCHCIKICLHWI